MNSCILLVAGVPACNKSIVNYNICVQVWIKQDKSHAEVHEKMHKKILSDLRDLQTFLLHIW